MTPHELFQKCIFQAPVIGKALPNSSSLNTVSFLPAPAVLCFDGILTQQVSKLD